MSKAPVAVVIVSWNSRRHLKGCLDSLGRLVRTPLEIVVVDSASTDGSPELLQTDYPDVKLIACDENVGFCRGNNLGFRATSAPFVLALNPDTVLEPTFLEELLPAFDDPSVGLASGKLLRFDRSTLDSAGQSLRRSRRARDRGYGKPDRGQYDADEEVFGVCGAAALYRRAMLDSIADPGGEFFNETYFAFGEDLDLAWRARRRGWRALYRHRAVGYHERGGTAVGSPRLRRFAAILGRGPEVRFHIVKNRWLSIVRNDSVAGYVVNIPFIWARDLAVLGLLAVGSPSVLLRLWRERGLVRDARRRRRLDASRPKVHVQGGTPE